MFLMFNTFYDSNRTNLVVRRELHSSHTVNVLLDLVEQVIPATDEPTFVLVVNQLKLIGLPHLRHLQTENNFLHQSS